MFANGWNINVKYLNLAVEIQLYFILTTIKERKRNFDPFIEYSRTDFIVF